MNNPLLVVQDVHKTYSPDTQVLKGISLQLDPGEIVVITGASGAGKSTLLHIIGGLEQVDHGDVILAGNSLQQLGDEALARVRNTQIGFIFQFHYLLPEFTALENVQLPGMMMRRSLPELQQQAQDLLRRVGLEPRLDHKPGELSGGECQRVALARALVNKPRLILADEPTGNLDSQAGERVVELIREVVQQLQTSFLIVTHHEALASIADRQYHIQDGIILTH